MDESSAWLPFLSFKSMNLAYIQAVCTAIMSKKLPSDKYRDEIVEMESGGLHTHEQDVRNRGLVSASTHKHRKSRGRRSPTPSNEARASSGSAAKRKNPKEHHKPKE